MKYICHTLNFKIEEQSVITFGKFDGLHRGHELLMQELLKQKEANAYRAVVFTFDIPPRKATQNVEAKVITTNYEKQRLFRNNGVDYLIECPFTKEIMCMEPEKFIQWIVEALHVKCVVVGSDFCFGHNRAGNYKTLQMYEEKYGYQTVVFDKMQEDHRDISSTFVREELEHGHIEKANHLLGYPFFFTGNVVHGNHIGRKMGFPTINMIPPKEKILPPNGVYVTRVIVNQKEYKGISNIGNKPTIGDKNPLGVETFILDFDGDIYYEEITLEFLKYIRPEIKFENLDELQNQIVKDLETANKYYENVTEIC